MTNQDKSGARKSGATRKLFEDYCREGVRPKMYDLTQTAGGEYVSHFTEWAWRIYRRGIEDGIND